MIMCNPLSMRRKNLHYLKKSTWKIVAASVFILLIALLSIIYLLTSTPHRDKMYFLMSPKPVAFFTPPPGKQADAMFVWISVVKESTYGSFTMAIVGYETYNTLHPTYEYHWYTDNPTACTDYANLFTKVYSLFNGTPIEHQYDVTPARVNIQTSEHQLNATINVNGQTLLTAQYKADTNTPLQSRIEPISQWAQELYLSVEAYRPMLTATVTGIETGNFTEGRYEYIDTELIDTSLLH